HTPAMSLRICVLIAMSVLPVTSVRTKSLTEMTRISWGMVGLPRERWHAANGEDPAMLNPETPAPGHLNGERFPLRIGLARHGCSKKSHFANEMRCRSLPGEGARKMKFADQLAWVRPPGPERCPAREALHAMRLTWPITIRPGSGG